MIYKSPPPNFKKELDVAGCYVECGGKFLLLHRHAHKPNGSKWGIPAGKVDAGETPRKTMVRELREETGIKVTPDELCYFGFVSVSNSIAFYYHMFSITFEKVPDVLLSPNEHQDFRWATSQEALAMDLVDDEDPCIRLFYDIP